LENRGDFSSIILNTVHCNAAAAPLIETAFTDNDGI
jgi:hypothetical protein